jgi:hypothetical protein
VSYSGAIRDHYAKQVSGTLEQSHQCGCIGPQNGEPVCPCQMRCVKVVDGRYVMTRDLGPASPAAASVAKAEAAPKAPGEGG